MKSFLGYVGFFVGMIVGVATDTSFLLVVFAIAGAFIGRAIGANIEEERENERRRQEESERCRRQAEYEAERKRQRKSQAISLAQKYPEATKKYFMLHWGISKSSISSYDITDDKVEKLLSHSEYQYQQEEQQLSITYRLQVQREEAERRRKAEEAERRRKAEEAERRRKLAEKFNYSSIGGFRYGYCFDYYPVSRFPSVSYQDQENRRSVWNFKDGAYSIGLKYLKDFIDGNYTREEMKNLAVCVIPASTVSKNNLRFKTLCSKIAEELPIINGFDFISIAYDRNDSREHKSSNTVANLNFSNSVYGKNVVLVDDVTTRGTSFLQVATLLKQKGALSVTGFFLGKTYSL